MPNVWFGYGLCGPTLSGGYTDLPRKVHCWIDYHVENFFQEAEKQNGTIMSVYVYVYIALYASTK
jgi:hypothetical protein